MGFKLTNYVKLWPWLQFVGVELVAGALVYQQFGRVLSTVIVVAATALSAFAFYQQYRVQLLANPLRSLFEAHRLIQAVGYAGILAGFFVQFPNKQAGDMTTFVGTGVVLAGFAYDLLYP